MEPGIVKVPVTFPFLSLVSVVVVWKTWMERKFEPGPGSTLCEPVIVRPLGKVYPWLMVIEFAPVAVT